MPLTWEQIRDELEGRGLVIHHWDADGVCSARLLLERLDAENTTPALGDYSLGEREFRLAEEHDWVLVADMALPEADVRRLAANSTVAVLDHHSQKPLSGVLHYNPVAAGAPQESHPACSWEINRLLGNEVNLFAVLGLVGDRGETIRENPPFWRILSEYSAETGVSFTDLAAMVEMIDSCFRAGDRDGVIEAPRWLLKHGSPAEILGNARWMRNNESYRSELGRVLNQEPELHGSTRVKRFSSPANIISAVARDLTWRQGYDSITVNTGYFPDRDQVYVRSKTRDLTPMIRRGIGYGYSCGGKKDVLGAVVPKKNVERFVEELLGFLSN